MTTALDTSIDAFLEMMLAERGAAQNTISAYQRDLENAAAFLIKRKIRLEMADQASVEAYLAGLAKQGLSPRTSARKLSSLKQYYRFLCSEKYRADDPCATLRGAKSGRSLPKTLSVNVVEALLNAANAGKGREAIRMAALLEILYSTGLRVSELVGLPYALLKSLTTGKGAVLVAVRGKGKKERLVPFTVTALHSLEKYLAVRIEFMKPEEESSWLFPSRGHHLTRQRFGQLLKELGIRAGINPEQLSPHAIRHSFASHLLAGGADLRAIQELLGHSDIATTQIYTFVEREALTKLVTDHHPLAQRQSKV